MLPTMTAVGTGHSYGSGNLGSPGLRTNSSSPMYQRHRVRSCTKLPQSLFHAATPVREALDFYAMQDGFDEFIDAHLTPRGLRTVGDIQVLSTHTIDALAHNDDVAFHPHWNWVVRQRNVDPELPLDEVLLQFPNVTEEDAAMVRDHVGEKLGALMELADHQVFALPATAQVMDACEKLRARLSGDLPPYTAVPLATNAFCRVLGRTVESFALSHTHKSWRKGQEDRQIVTCAITYVNWTGEGACKCKKEGDPSVPVTPANNPVDATSLDAMWEDIRVPNAWHWCQCERNYVLAVNYELSTPSGSRCSEQNALGRLAAMGMPTSAIREVFVHGRKAGSEPNPLFPCGVCENMLTKVSKDILKAHGGDLELYLFEQTSNAMRLVAIPMADMSLRREGRFKRFVRDLGASQLPTPNVRPDRPAGGSAAFPTAPLGRFSSGSPGQSFGGSTGDGPHVTP